MDKPEPDAIEAEAKMNRLQLGCERLASTLQYRDPGNTYWISQLTQWMRDVHQELLGWRAVRGEQAINAEPPVVALSLSLPLESAELLRVIRQEIERAFSIRDSRNVATPSKPDGA